MMFNFAASVPIIKSFPLQNTNTNGIVLCCSRGIAYARWQTCQASWIKYCLTGLNFWMGSPCQGNLSTEVTPAIAGQSFTSFATCQTHCNGLHETRLTTAFHLLWHFKRLIALALFRRMHTIILVDTIGQNARFCMNSRKLQLRFKGF